MAWVMLESDAMMFTQRLSNLGRQLRWTETSSTGEPQRMETNETKGLTASHEPTATTGFLGERADEYAQAYAEETPGGFALRVRRQRVLELFDQPGGKVLDV